MVGFNSGYKKFFNKKQKDEKLILFINYEEELLSRIFFLKNV